MRTAGQHNTTTADAKHSADDFEEDTSDVRVAYECCVPECAALICSCSVPQYSHGVNKGTLAKNVAKVEAKEKELKAAQEKAKAAKKAAKEAAKAAKKAEEAAKKKAAATKATPTPDAPAAGTPAAIAQPPPPPPPPE